MKTDMTSAKVLDFQSAQIATEVAEGLIGQIAWSSASKRRKLLDAEFGRGAYNKVFEGIPSGSFDEHCLSVAQRRLQRLVLRRLPDYPLAA